MSVPHVALSLPVWVLVPQNATPARQPPGEGAFRFLGARAKIENGCLDGYLSYRKQKDDGRFKVYHGLH